MIVLLAQVNRPNMLNPAASEAHRLADVGWLLFAMAAAVAILVFTLIAVGLFRRGDAADAEVGPGSPQRDHRFIMIGGLVLPVVILTVVAVATITTVIALRQEKPHELAIEVRGVQWFWRVHYSGTDVDSANEVRMAVDRPVVITLKSDDVIHSFWVPSMAGKLDVIPGQTNVLRFTPTKVGRFRGECAEFCGLQHANMAFDVVVMKGPDFDRWLSGRQKEPAAPATDQILAGRQVFGSLSCSGCHTVTGVSDGTRGPDLSDFGGRRTLGAGVATNTPAHLAQWVRNAPRMKPGVNMPPIALTDRQVSDLVAYLESLS